MNYAAHFFALIPSHKVQYANRNVYRKQDWLFHSPTHNTRSIFQALSAMTSETADRCMYIIIEQNLLQAGSNICSCSYVSWKKVQLLYKAAQNSLSRSGSSTPRLVCSKSYFEFFLLNLVYL